MPQTGPQPRRLLIVSPHYPPADVVDMHRVRASSRYYEDHGWSPTILAVRPEDTGRLVDERLNEMASDRTPVVRTGAFPEKIARGLGFSAIGFRAYRQMQAAGDRLIGDWKPDLAFFSTTAFPLMTLGERWRRRFGLPYVLDMQDPWFAAPPDSLAQRRTTLKNRLMYALHDRLEARAMSRVGGLMAVSGQYLDALRDRYPALADIPADVIPFGIEPHDFDVARRRGRPTDFEFDRPDAIRCVYAGRVTEGMHASVRALLSILELGANLPQTGRLRIGFLGTGYQLGGNPHCVTPLAEAMNLGRLIREIPDRVALLDSLSTMATSDLLLVLGSDDLAYQPSKLFQCLATDLPVLCVARSSANYLASLETMPSVFVLFSDQPLEPQAQRFESWLSTSARAAVKEDPIRSQQAYQRTAQAMAARECAIFDKVLAQ